MTIHEKHETLEAVHEYGPRINEWYEVIGEIGGKATVHGRSRVLQPSVGGAAETAAIQSYIGALGDDGLPVPEEYCEALLVAAW